MILSQSLLRSAAKEAKENRQYDTFSNKRFDMMRQINTICLFRTVSQTKSWLLDYGIYLRRSVTGYMLTGLMIQH